MMDWYPTSFYTPKAKATAAKGGSSGAVKDFTDVNGFRTRIGTRAHTMMGMLYNIREIKNMSANYNTRA